ncbi:hypothetical protein CBG24_04455 [Limosilactobacillus reuteri]|uniref:Uncharacterized protein n=1 Tax=Limosilactobacillus reuteri TaxID=1598 RepID=A0AB73PP33_LIMRT|nr:hypothetical protein [Limosilactobacillus reuteri]OYS85959.1 hypothetical protein CBG19_09175 [Limosilactobacillus reuteri]OYS90726.1 hypothetical protein CBG18_04935 [Limosilactobacillus reuteri]OYS94099.1 hypothetical protein CBG15_05005 [Limosilactobacillus reuteri]OYS95638.1 hypothetical protein CBG10_03990 [Limosilactobacillus reuteri]OYS97431.1 hypothetical protein CBG13_04125 [Limosilactobacillus reuteri]
MYRGIDKFELKDDGLYINDKRISCIKSLKIDCPDHSELSTLTIQIVGKLKGIDFGKNSQYDFVKGRLQEIT